MLYAGKPDVFGSVNGQAMDEVGKKVFIFSPLLGVCLYWLFGINRIHRRVHIRLIPATLYAMLISNYLFDERQFKLICGGVDQVNKIKIILCLFLFASVYCENAYARVNFGISADAIVESGYETIDSDSAESYVNQALALLEQQISNAVPSNSYNVQNYGAVGNGINDDTVAINNAIIAVNQTGGTLYFPSGTYIITAHLTDIGSNIIVTGDTDATLSNEIPIIHGIPNPGQIPMLGIIGDNVKMQNITFSSIDPELPRESRGFYLCVGWGADGVIVTQCTFRYTASHFAVFASGTSIPGQGLSNAIFYDNTWSDLRGDGIHVGQFADNIIIASNTIVNAGDDSIAIVWDAAPSYMPTLPIVNEDPRMPQYILIHNNNVTRTKDAFRRSITHGEYPNIYDAGGHGVIVEHAKNVKVFNNNISNTTLSGICLLSWYYAHGELCKIRTKDIQVHANNIENIFKYRSYQFGDDNDPYSMGYGGEQYEDGKANGIWVFGADGVSLENNEIKQTEYYYLKNIQMTGIVVENSEDISMTDNNAYDLKVSDMNNKENSTFQTTNNVNYLYKDNNTYTELPKQEYYSLFYAASNAYWHNASSQIVFGTHTAAGAVMYLTEQWLEDGQKYSNLLFTHPEWIPYGFVHGAYLLPIQSSEKSYFIKAKYGFFQGANQATDGVEVRFSIFYEGQFTHIYYYNKLYDYKLIETVEDGYKFIKIPDEFKGKTITIFISVDAKATSWCDWLAWTNAKIITW